MKVSAYPFVAAVADVLPLSAFLVALLATVFPFFTWKKNGEKKSSCLKF